jgi:hypothetical protein
MRGLAQVFNRRPVGQRSLKSERVKQKFDSPRRETPKNVIKTNQETFGFVFFGRFVLQKPFDTTCFAKHR